MMDALVAMVPLETRAFFGGLLGCPEGFVSEFKGLKEPTPAQLLARR